MNTTVKSTRPHLSGDEIAWAYVVGGGLLLVMLSLGINAAQGGDPSGTLGILLFIGFLFILGGGIGWALEFRPWTKFDDLTTPLYTGHAHHDSVVTAADAGGHPVADHDNPGESASESAQAAHETPQQALHG